MGFWIVFLGREKRRAAPAAPTAGPQCHIIRFRMLDRITPLPEGTGSKAKPTS